MSVRDLNYKDYGIDDLELKQLIEYCRIQDLTCQTLVQKACYNSNPEIAIDLYYSLAGMVSYDDLKCIKSVPIPKVDFYGYRRKAISILKMLRDNNHDEPI